MTATNGNVEEFFKNSAGGRPPERASCRLVDSTEGYRTPVLTLMA